LAQEEVQAKEVSEQGELRRVRLPRHRRRDRNNPLKGRSLDILLAVFIFITLLLLFNAVRLAAPSSRPIPEQTSHRYLLVLNILYWMGYQGGSQLVGLILFMVAIWLVIWRARWYAVKEVRWYARECPDCRERQLKRMRRQWYHRLLYALKVPARPYICANCHWQGVRIDESKIR